MSAEDKHVRLTREELYKVVWKTPIYRLAKEFGITGTGLAKICRRMDLPVPPRGYWNKLKAGKRVTRHPLPSAQENTQLEVTISPTPPKPSPSVNAPLPQGVVSEIANETSRIKPIQVPRTLANPHPMIRRWIEEDRRRERETRRLKWSMPHEAIDGTAVKKRRLRILSALIAEWERLGHHTKSEGCGTHGIYFEINGRKIEFALFEYERQRRRPLTEEERYDPFYQHNKWRQVKEPTGQLIFRVTSHIGTGARKEWRDEEGCPLEAHLPEMLRQLVATPALLGLEEERRREAECRLREDRQKQEEIRRRRDADAARWQHFLQLASETEQVGRTRAFLEELEFRSGILNGHEGPEGPHQWLAWANAKLDQMDPLRRSVADLMQENLAIDEWSIR